MARRIHVVGAGIAGLAAAVELVASGYPVTLYEQAGHAGGRCRSFFDDTLQRSIDNGNHLVLSGNRSLYAFLRRSGRVTGCPVRPARRSRSSTYRPASVGRCDLGRGRSPGGSSLRSGGYGALAFATILPVCASLGLGSGAPSPSAWAGMDRSIAAFGSRWRLPCSTLGREREPRGYFGQCCERRSGEARLLAGRAWPPAV